MLGQHWTETTYVDEANYDFNTRNTECALVWNVQRCDSRFIYCKTNTEATAISPSFTQATKDSRLAQIEILSVYAG
jgi:autotransporter adhesin